MYDDETARVWDGAMGKEILRVKHGDAVASVAFFPDGRWAVSNVRSKTVYVWQMATGDVIARLELRVEHRASVPSVAISPDERWLASASGNVVGIHSLRPEELIAPTCLRLWR